MRKSRRFPQCPLFRGLRVSARELAMREPSMFRLVEPDAESVRVRVADGTERRLIENLIEFYIYEFMQLEPPFPTRFDDRDCYPAFSDLDRTLSIEDIASLLIRSNERLAASV